MIEVISVFIVLQCFILSSELCDLFIFVINRKTLFKRRLGLSERTEICDIPRELRIVVAIWRVVTFAPVCLAHEEDGESISCCNDLCFSRGFFAISQIIVDRAGIELAHRSTKATRPATGTRLVVWESRAAASVSFRASNHEPSIMKPEASGYRRGVAWHGMA